MLVGNICSNSSPTRLTGRRQISSVGAIVSRSQRAQVPSKPALRSQAMRSEFARLPPVVDVLNARLQSKAELVPSSQEPIFDRVQPVDLNEPDGFNDAIGRTPGRPRRRPFP